MLHIQEIQARIEQRFGIYRQLLQAIVDDYNKKDEAREYARRAATSRPEGGKWLGDYYLRGVDFDTDWEVRVHRNMTEQLQAEVLEEVEALRKYAAELERRASKAGYDATNALPRPQQREPSAQQSSKVRNEAAKRLSELRRASGPP